jgi:hypothetical protein
VGVGAEVEVEEDGTDEGGPVRDARIFRLVAATRQAQEL